MKFAPQQTSLRRAFDIALFLVLSVLSQAAAAVPAPDLYTTKVDFLHLDNDTDGVADVGDVIGYTIIVTNNSDSPVANLKVNDPLDLNLSFDSGTTDFALDSLGVAWTDFFNLGSGASATFHLYAEVIDRFVADSVSNQAFVISGTAYLDASDDPDVAITFNDPTVTPISQGAIPSPATASLMAVGLAGLGYQQRKQRRNRHNF